MAKEKAPPPKGDYDIKRCAYCRDKFKAEGHTQYLRDKKTYCSGECRRAAAIELRAKRDNRIVLPIADNDRAEELAMDYSMDKRILTLVALKLINTLARQGKVNPAALATKWGYTEEGE